MQTGLKASSAHLLMPDKTSDSANSRQHQQSRHVAAKATSRHRSTGSSHMSDDGEETDRATCLPTTCGPRSPLAWICDLGQDKHASKPTLENSLSMSRFSTNSSRVSLTQSDSDRGVVAKPTSASSEGKQRTSGNAGAIIQQMLMRPSSKSSNAPAQQQQLQPPQQQQQQQQHPQMTQKQALSAFLANHDSEEDEDDAGHQNQSHQQKMMTAQQQLQHQHRRTSSSNSTVRVSPHQQTQSGSTLNGRGNGPAAHTGTLEKFSPPRNSRHNSHSGSILHQQQQQQAFDPSSMYQAAANLMFNASSIPGQFAPEDTTHAQHQPPQVMSTMMRPPSASQTESRIVAPHVSKLAPSSAVEVRLQASETDFVAVLCSVDVLKMRSGFFHDVLTEQETSSTYPPPSTTGSNGLLWRDVIHLQEEYPYEAAAFLESLHEGRTLFRGEWNYCWARLSVTWIIEDLVMEYATQIEDHMNKVVSCIHSHHWRTNPVVLAGMRMAVFRKGSNPTPTVVNGYVLESPANIGYSKVRVAFDQHDRSNTAAGTSVGVAGRPVSMPNTSTTAPLNTPATANNNNSSANGYPTPPTYAIHGAAMTSPGVYSNMPAANTQQQHPHAQQQYHPGNTLNNSNNARGAQANMMTSPRKGMHVDTSMMDTHHSNHHPPHHAHHMHTTAASSAQIVGDITEPFWVQPAREGAMWMDPDELFMMDAKRLISSTDKRVFWEMAKALIELPEISGACSKDCMLRTVEDLVQAMKRPEYRVLWTAEAPEILPKQAAEELLRAAFVAGLTGLPTDRV